MSCGSDNIPQYNFGYVPHSEWIWEILMNSLWNVPLPQDTIKDFNDVMVITSKTPSLHECLHLYQAWSQTIGIVHKW